MKKLKEYNKKRDFSSTKEPKGEINNTKSTKLKFVIQYHKARAKHYDFRLEYDGVLLSWAIPKGLSYNPKDKRLAVMVEDHPLDYINFEGIIPKGNYGAGSVEIYDKGYYIPKYDIKYGLKKGHLQFDLYGDKYKGEWSLVKIDDKNWLMIKGQDEYATAKTKKFKTTNPFKTCDVMLATLKKEIPTGKNFCFEIKFDGYRMLSFVENKKVKMLSRNKIDYTKKFPGIEKSLSQIDEESFVIDGEVVALDDKGRSDFQLLHARMKNGGTIVYAIFDILALNGEDLRTKPLKERKEILKRLLYKEQDYLMYSDYVIGKGKTMFNFAKKNNLEGIMAKNLDSEYVGKRSDDWQKIKCYQRQEFVIGGYTTTLQNPEISAFLVGYYDKNQFIYIGKVGTGLNEKEKQQLSTKLKKLKIDKSPFKNSPNLKNINYVSPKLVAEIQYSEVTKDGHLRQPSFAGLRQDKNPKDVVLEVAK